MSEQRSGVWPEQPTPIEFGVCGIAHLSELPTGPRVASHAGCVRRPLLLLGPAPHLTEASLVRTGQVCCEGVDRLPRHLGHPEDARTIAKAGPCCEDSGRPSGTAKRDRRGADTLTTVERVAHRARHAAIVVRLVSLFAGSIGAYGSSRHPRSWSDPGRRSLSEVWRGQHSSVADLAAG